MFVPDFLLVYETDEARRTSLTFEEIMDEDDSTDADPDLLKTIRDYEWRRAFIGELRKLGVFVEKVNNINVLLPS